MATISKIYQRMEPLCWGRLLLSGRNRGTMETGDQTRRGLIYVVLEIIPKTTVQGIGFLFLLLPQ
jgi:hypothetical protein